MNRLESVRQGVDAILLALASGEDRRCGFIHLYGVSLAATWLAERRGLNVELAAVAGMFHDLSTYATGPSTKHAAASARLASRLLEPPGTFTPQEIATISHAIAKHSDKASIDGPMDELLKDADVLQHWLYNPALPSQASHTERRARLVKELGQGA